jgi:hypothetical protein
VSIETGEIEREAVLCVRPLNFLQQDQIVQCALDDPKLNVSGEEVEASVGDEADDLTEGNPEEQGLDPDDPECCPATEQAGYREGDEDDNPFAQFKARRRRVASYTFEKQMGVLPTQLNDILGD